MLIINHAKYNDSASPLFKQKIILKQEDIFKMHTCQFMYKLQMGILPNPLLCLIPTNQDIHGP